jgi:hypothetical protein
MLPQEAVWNTLRDADEAVRATIGPGRPSALHLRRKFSALRRRLLADPPAGKDETVERLRAIHDECSGELVRFRPAVTRALPSGMPGGQRIYANIAIEAALTIRMVFQLPLRQTEGFLHSLVDLLDVEIPIPDHTTLSRRLKTLGEIPCRAVPSHRPIHLFIDSTGLRIHVGHRRKPPKHRAWRKLHLAVDASTGEIVASDLTSRRTLDCTWGTALLGQIHRRVASVMADGAYDTEGVYEAAHAKAEGRGVRVLIPLGRNAQLRLEPSATLKQRNRNIRSIRRLGRRASESPEKVRFHGLPEMVQ